MCCISHTLRCALKVYVCVCTVFNFWLDFFGVLVFDQRLLAMCRWAQKAPAVSAEENWMQCRWWRSWDAPMMMIVLHFVWLIGGQFAIISSEEYKFLIATRHQFWLFYLYSNPPSKHFCVYIYILYCVIYNVMRKGELRWLRVLASLSIYVHDKKKQNSLTRRNSIRFAHTRCCWLYGLLLMVSLF